jgi:hypothetical protein
MSVEIKAVVSVAEMARMVGLSRARFYQLIGSAFPWPVYCIETKRPFYDELAQTMCLEVRRRNCGIDGRPIMFYARRLPTAPLVNRPRKLPAARPKHDGHADLIDALRGLGLTNVSTNQVTAAVNEAFPNGIADVDQSEIIRGVFVKIKRRNTTDNVRR